MKTFLKRLIEYRFIIYLICFITILSYRFADKKIDKQFMPYIIEMLKDTKDFNMHDLRHTSIKFKELNKNEERMYIGLCLPVINVIYINPEFWNYANDNEKKLVLRHELEHCVDLKLFHRDEALLNDYCPASAFEPYIPIPECCNKHYKYYMEEMDKH